MLFFLHKSFTLHSKSTMLVNARSLVLISLLPFIFLSCGAPKQSQKPSAKPGLPKSPAPVVEAAHPDYDKGDTFFEKLFKEYPSEFDKILENRKDYNVQIIYTRIDRNAAGEPLLTDYRFNTDHQEYFYPASTVKLPVALLALEKINALAAKGIDRQTTMLTEADYSGQTQTYNDPNTFEGKPTIEQYIKRIFLVSDNEAYNRLYEFVGQEYINDALHKKGYESAQILHRLGIFLTDDQNRHTNPVNFYDSSGRLIYRQPMLLNKKSYERRNDYVGRSYYSNGKLIDKPMTFSGKNRLSLDDLHKILQAIIFPLSVKPAERFNLTDNDRSFVLKYMSSYPRESVFPFYDSSYTDAYGKFLLFGGKGNVTDPQLRIFNKPGDAYGQLVDVAYVADFKNKVEFMVSATIYCNSDAILNDDHYDYETLGFPFMKNLGKVLYEYELKRKRNYPSNLSSFIFSYDK